MRKRILVVLVLLVTLLVYASVGTQSGFSAKTVLSTTITVDTQKINKTDKTPADKNADSETPPVQAMIESE